jgi:hypothetical protein
LFCISKYKKFTVPTHPVKTARAHWSDSCRLLAQIEGSLSEPRHRQHRCFPTAVSPPPDSPPRRLRPPPLPAIKGAQNPREQPFFLPPVAPTALPCSVAVEPPCSAAPGPPLSSPSPPRALRYRIPPSRTASRRPSLRDAAPAIVPLRSTAHHRRATASVSHSSLLPPN